MGRGIRGHRGSTRQWLDYSERGGSNHRRWAGGFEATAGRPNRGWTTWREGSNHRRWAGRFEATAYRHDVAGLLGEGVAITGDRPGDSRPPRVDPTVVGLLGKRVAITGNGPGDSRPPRVDPTVAGLLRERVAITGDGPGDSRPLRVDPTVAGLLGERAAITGDGMGDSTPRERSGLLSNSVCFVSKSVLWCFAMFCGVLRVFCGCFVVFCECISKNSVLRCFAVFCGCFAMFWTCFANFFCRRFLSGKKTHSTVLRFIAQSVFCSFCAVCIFLGLFCAVW